MTVMTRRSSSYMMMTLLMVMSLNILNGLEFHEVIQFVEREIKGKDKYNAIQATNKLLNMFFDELEESMYNVLN